MIFNGTDFDLWMRTSATRRLLPPVEADAREVPGRNGSAFASSRLGNLEIEVFARLDLGAYTAAQLAAARRAVGAALFAEAPAPLYLDEDPDVYYMAVLTNTSDLSSLWKNGSCTLEFTAYDPVAYGAQRTATVPSGGSVNIDVGGTYPTRPVFSTTNASRGDDNLWGVKLDDGPHLRTVLPTANTKTVVFDCEARSCAVGAARTPKLPTIDSDWLELAPGQHTVANDAGTGGCTVAWRERWL